MKEILRLVGVLAICCLVAGFLLAWVDDMTREPILAAAREETLAALRRVLPAYDNAPDQETLSFPGDAGPVTFHIARREGAFAGTAFVVTSSKGYAGDIQVMVGVLADDTIQGIEILAQKETPGLGARVAEPAFRGQFAGKPVDGTRWRVAKEQGEIDQVTAATISSRAVVEAVETGLTVYRANRAAITAGTESKAGTP